MKKQVEFVEHNGRKYRIQSNGVYYRSSILDQGETLLHRVVWAEHNGPIPEKHDIHHKDGNWRNNAIDNLQCLPVRKHRQMHAHERMLDPVYVEKNKQSLLKAQEEAKKWHGSKEGLEWHSRNSKAIWEVRVPVKAVCSVCSGEYETFFPSRSRFCGHACEQRESYLRHKTKISVCVECAKAFTHNKYRKQECCSHSCSNRLRKKRKDAKEAECVCDFA